MFVRRHWLKPHPQFEWDPEFFPNPKQYLADIKKKFGINICVWSTSVSCVWRRLCSSYYVVNPYIGQPSSMFKEGKAKGYFIKRTNGEVWQWNYWQPGMAIVDFTNPEATAWYLGKLRALLDMGVDCFKTDFGERIPHIDVAYHDGSDPRRMHNYYAVLYNEKVFGLLEDVRGKDEAVLFARSAAAGGQRFPVVSRIHIYLWN